MSCSVLVTGAGSGVGQGIIKALRLSTLGVRVTATDISVLGQGLYRADAGAVLPPVESDGALDAIIQGIRNIRPDAVMIGSEFDLAFFAAHRQTIERETGALVVASDPSVVALSADKLATANFLRDNGLPYPLTFAPDTLDEALENARETGYPCVLKPRTGTSARGVHVLEGPDGLRRVFDPAARPLIQRMIARPSANLGAEYTCSVFRLSGGGLLGPFTARRTLRGGNSWVVEVRRFDALHPLLLAVGAALPCMGTLNIQLMDGPDGPVPFEFNARFSGTTAVRAYFGFNEPDMTLRHYLLGQDLPEPEVREGLAFRYLEEVFLDGAPLDGLDPGNLPRGATLPWF